MMKEVSLPRGDLLNFSSIDKKWGVVFWFCHSGALSLIFA